MEDDLVMILLVEFFLSGNIYQNHFLYHINRPSRKRVGLRWYSSRAENVSPFGSIFMIKDFLQYA